MPYEVNSNSGDVAFCVCIICESKQQARLSHSRVTDQKKLEQVIVPKQGRVLVMSQTATAR